MTTGMQKAIEEARRVAAAVAQVKQESPLTHDRVPLEGCICGGCFDCPDGWHDGDELPCLCTPDCARFDD